MAQMSKQLGTSFVGTVYLNHDGHQFWLAVKQPDNELVPLSSEIYFKLILEGSKYLDPKEKKILIDQLTKS